VHEADELAIWKYLVDDDEGRSLLKSAECCNSQDVKALTQLRKLAPARTVRVALELSEARHKARLKFPPPIAENIIADRAGIEMASSQMVADYKAKRMACVSEPGHTLVLDLCSGIGSDAMSLSAMGFETIAVERNPLRAWMTERNAKCHVVTTDVTNYDLDKEMSEGKDRFFHLDPSRRREGSGSGTGHRSWRFSDYEPGPEFIRSMIANQKWSGAVKLGPGVDIDEIITQDQGTHPCEIEFISEGSTHRLTQAIAWTGVLATANRRATHLPSGEYLCGDSDWDQPPIADHTGSYLFTIDPSAERAQLLNELCTTVNLPLIHPRLGLLTGDTITTNPWLIAAFQVETILPYHERRVKKWLRERQAGIVTIKTRDQVVNTDQLQRAWRGKGENSFTVFVLRFDRSVRAIITRRIDG